MNSNLVRVGMTVLVMGVYLIDEENSLLESNVKYFEPVIVGNSESPKHTVIATGAM